MPDTRNVRPQSDEFGTQPTSPSPPSKVKRVRGSRRPKFFPVPIRQKLTLLGHTPDSNETNRENLTLIIDRLTADLSKYRDLADRWQKQYVELENSKGEQQRDFTPLQAPNGLDDVLLDFDASPHSIEEISTFGAQILGRLDSTANPSLSLVGIGAPKLYSDVSGLVHSRDAFLAVLAAADLMSALHSSTQHRASSLAQNIIMARGKCEYKDYFPRIHYRKPDFDGEKAKKVWNDIFAPMNFQPATVEYNATSSCRRDVAYDNDDPDIDHFDRIMAAATDLEIIDMLHYTTLLIGGMHQAVFDDPALAPARAHLGRSCERLLREVVFTRNLTAKSAELGQSLMDGLVGTFCHFSTHGMASAVSSILELAWLLYSKNPNRHDPMMRVFLSFFALVLSNSESKRAGWMHHISEALRYSSQSKSFAALVLGSFGTSYNALLSNDEATFLRYSLILDDVLAPGPPKQGVEERWDFTRYHSAEPSPRPLDAPSSSWTPSPIENEPFEPTGVRAYDFCVGARDLPDHPVSPIVGIHTVFPPVECNNRLSMVSPELSEVPIQSPDLYAHQPAIIACPCSRNINMPEYAPTSTHFITSMESEELLDPWNTTSFSAEASFPSEEVPEALLPQDDTPDDQAQYSFLDESGNPYVPGENLKSIYRLTFLLMRAEAALLFQDEETCMHWVDEAEQLLISIPLDYMFQRVFLMKNVIKATCHFPTGTRTVIDEFERRLLIHDSARCSLPSRGNVSIGALWRTP